MPTIQALRTQIDTLNLKLLEILSERAQLAEEIGELQTQMGTAHYDPVREAEMLDALTEANTGPLYRRYGQKPVQKYFSGEYAARA